MKGKHMDIKISGSGQISGGEYDNVRISGSGKASGKILCDSLHCSGSMKSDSDIECKKDMKVSGSLSTDKNVSADELHVAGSAKFGGDCSCTGEVKISGSLAVGGKMKGKDIRVSGGIRVDGDMEGENIVAAGAVRCEGLINAERVEIKTGGSGIRIGQIGGGTILIYRDHNSKSISISRLPIFSKLVSNTVAGNYVELIEGENIAIEFCKVGKIVGNTVAIGAGCEVDKIEYSDTIEIHEDAKVKEHVKI